LSKNLYRNVICTNIKKNELFEISFVRTVALNTRKSDDFRELHEKEPEMAAIGVATNYRYLWRHSWRARHITSSVEKHYSLYSEDDFRSGCRNVSHQQQSFSELPSPELSHYTKYTNCDYLVSEGKVREFWNLITACGKHDLWQTL